MSISKRLAFALGVTVAAAAGWADEAFAHRGLGPCQDHAPRERVVRVHLRCDDFDVDPPQRLDIIIGRLDAPRRWRPAWGGDGSLAWASRTLGHYGCGPAVMTPDGPVYGDWYNGEIGIGRRCDY